MAKLTNETINKLLANDKYMRRIGLSVGIEARSVRIHLRQNKENGILTKYTALDCIKDLLRYSSLEYAIDRSNEEIL